jgi:hypothetical protein
MGKSNIPKSIIIKQSNSSNIQKYHNLLNILEKMVINTYKDRETD